MGDRHRGRDLSVHDRELGWIEKSEFAQFLADFEQNLVATTARMGGYCQAALR